MWTDVQISIHALRVEGDICCPECGSTSIVFLSTPSGWRATIDEIIDINVNAQFLSTPSGWRATGFGKLNVKRLAISIHALRVEGDHQSSNRIPLQCNFYPRPPGGGRQQKRTKFSSVFAQKGEEFASLRRGKRKICRWRFKKDKFWVLIWCEGSGKSVCALASHCG